MKKRSWIRALTLAFCLVFLLSSCSLRDMIEDYLPFGGGGEPAAEAEQRRTIPFSQMEYMRPDIDALEQRFGELTIGIQNAGSFDELWRCDEEASELADEFSTMYQLAEINRYLNTNDTAYQEEVRYCKESSVRLSTLINDLNQAIVDSPYAGEYEQEMGSYVYASIENELLLNSPEVEDLKKQIQNLRADYNEDLTSLTVSFEGVEYTNADIEALDDSSLIYMLQAEFNNQYAEHFAGIYSQLVALDKQVADILGFDSAAEMYYLSFSRDYSPTDALALCGNVKEQFVPISGAIYMSAGGSYPVSEEEAMAVMPSALAKIDPQLAEAYEFMLEYEVYDLSARPEKQSGIGFTTDLYSFDTQYIYTYWGGNLRSATTLYHEFGHFFDGWLHWNEDIVFNLDAAETYSQGLELLMQRFFPELGDDVQGMIYNHMADFSQAITYQCLLEELQLRLYEEPELNAAVIGGTYTDLLNEYGFGFASAGEVYNDWLQITHLFEAPFYTISYATSALTALQFWNASQENWKAGASLYMDMITSNQNQPFTRLCESVGLRGPMDPTLLPDVANWYSELYGFSDAFAA